MDDAVELLDRRPFIALGLLRVWIRDELGHDDGRPADGLHDMVVPEAGQKLMNEIRVGVRVCDRLAMLRTADNQMEVQSDAARLSAAMSEWRDARAAGFPDPDAQNAEA